MALNIYPIFTIFLCCATPFLACWIMTTSKWKISKFILILDKPIMTFHKFNNNSSNMNKYNKSMISKLVPPLNGLVNLVVILGCTTNGDVFVTLILVLISTDTKLNGSYLKSRKAIQYACSSNW